MHADPERDEQAEGPSAAWSNYMTSAYDAETSDETEAAAASWLEEQAQHPFLREVAVRSVARLGLEPGERVLEVGCGTGVFLPGLAESTGPTGGVVGFDHSAAFLDEARKRLVSSGLEERVELVQGDAHHLPFPDATFDAAHCERVLMHVEDPDRVIGEMRRVVRPGGRVVAAEVHAAGAGMDGADPELTARIARLVVAGIRNPHMGLSLRGRFVDSGFEGVSGEIVGYFEEELDQDEAEEVARIARDLAARGELEAERATGFVEDLEARRARGAYCGMSLMFIVSGRVPPAT